MNEYPNKYSDQKYSNIRIYSSHSGSKTDGQHICSLENAIEVKVEMWKV